jgi:3-hydroxyisobutyrate dehydrogenase
MGAAMCGHLLKHGYPLTVYSRTPSKAEPLLKAGATWADSAKQVADRSQVVFTMVGFPADVREVYLSGNGVLAGVQKGAIMVDMTTTQPSLAMIIYNAAQTRGCYALDAPVSGGDVGAREARLSIMVGGDIEAFEAVRPLLELMGRNIIYQGPAGTGQHAKLCNQIVIAGTIIGVCESLLYANRAGLDIEKMLLAIRTGAAGCWTLDNLAPHIVKRNFDPGFLVEHFIKDMGIALEEARRMNLALPGLALVHQLYVAAQAQGHGKKGTHALMLALEQLSHMIDSH